MKLARAMATVAGLTGLSRVAGFIRDILTAAILGAGPVADAFFVALKLPNLFRRITAEGAFSVSFVPLYARKLAQDSPEQADNFASNALAVMIFVLLPFTLLALAVMPGIIAVIAPGFEEQGLRYSTAVELSRITFPYLLLISISSLMGGVLNARDRFAPFAAAPVLFNISLIGALLFFTPFMQSAGHAMAWGVAVAGGAQFVWLSFFIRKAGVRLAVRRPVFNRDIKKLFSLMGPGIIGAGVMHINLFADMIIASLLPAGAISYLYYADRLNQLPLGMVGIAVGTALLPMLSKAIASDNSVQAQALFSRALEICLFLALPAAAGLFMIAQPIIVTLFQHGAFDAAAAQVTAKVLMAYALGIPAYVAVKVYSTAYWAREDTISPVKASVVSTLFNIAVSLILVFGLGTGVAGIAIGTALAGWLQLFLLHRGLKHRADIRLGKDFLGPLFKIIGACIIMMAVLAGLHFIAAPAYSGDETGLVMKIGGLAMMVAAGAGVYGLAALVLGVIKIQDMKTLLKRR